jgi:DNA adenine methylase
MTSADMPIKALSPWFGAKRNLARTIIEELGDHRSYWEPFCGSMAVLLAKPAASMETVNDLHGDLINLARVVQDRTLGPMLYRRLRRTIMAQQIHAAAAEEIRRDWTPAAAPDLDRAEAYFLAAWLGRNGVAGCSNYDNHYCARYTHNGGHAARRFHNAIRSIPAWRRRLRHVTALTMDAFELLERIEDAPGAAIYVDPPYLVKGAKYLHKLREGDHERLAESLSRFRQARVVVSYYQHPLLNTLYPVDRWKRREIEVSKAMASSGSRGKSDVRVTEVLLVNGPLNTRQEGGLFA